MTDTELIELRREKWRLNGNAVRTLDDARSFIESVGFCLMLPLPAPKTLLVPTFVGATLGSDEKLPMQRNALMTSSESAICGTALDETNDTASMCLNPALIRALR